MNYYIGEPGSTGRYFDDFDSFVSALRDLADACDAEDEETFEVEVVRDCKGSGQWRFLKVLSVRYV